MFLFALACSWSVYHCCVACVTCEIVALLALLSLRPTGLGPTGWDAQAVASQAGTPKSVSEQHSKAEIIVRAKFCSLAPRLESHGLGYHTPGAHGLGRPGWRIPGWDTQI